MLTTTPLVDFDEPGEHAQDPEELCPEPPPRTEEERQAWYREGIESIREFERTGLHVTLDEYRAWVEQLQTDPYAPMPKCHT